MTTKGPPLSLPSSPADFQHPEHDLLFVACFGIMEVCSSKVLDGCDVCPKKQECLKLLAKYAEKCSDAALKPEDVISFMEAFIPIRMSVAAQTKDVVTISESLLDALVRSKLSGLQLSLVLSFVRQTIKNGNEETTLTQNYCKKTTDTPQRTTISHALKQLVRKRVLSRKAKGPGHPWRYSVNKNYSEWRNNEK